jgi:Ca2+-binding EF-hand superfamily protein
LRTGRRPGTAITTATCDEWKKFVDRLFTSADRNRDGILNLSEFETVRKADATLADADFGYFDENQDGKITRKEFVDLCGSHRRVRATLEILETSRRLS